MINDANIVNYFDSPAQYIKKVKDEWGKFIRNKDIRGLEVRSEILKSWERSMNNGILHNQNGAKLVYDEKEMEKIYAKNSLLICTSVPILNEFRRMLRDRGDNSSIINLCDMNTIVLKTITTGRTAEKEVAFQQLLPGAILDEQYTGTTGVAMVKNTLQPYAIYGSEHFTDPAKTHCCAAAPIRYLSTRQLTGIISLSAKNLNIYPDTMGMITFVARTIESQIFSEYMNRSNFLFEKLNDTISRSKANLILAIDVDLNLIGSSKNQHAIIVNSYFQRKLRDDVNEHVKAAIDQYRECYKRGQKDEISFNTDDYTFNLAAIHYHRGLAGVILHAYKIEQSNMKINKDPFPNKAVKNAPTLIGHNSVFLSALDTAKKVANTDATVMLLGETGVGKEGFALTIYSYSDRADKPFVAVNCGAIPKELIGSELFGYAPGAFTGALSKGKPGKIETANTGTIFLDEIGELSLDAQTYLLRVLEEKKIVRLGSNQPIPIDIRIIAATNAKLLKLVHENKFRSDLYYRLNVVNVKIPPLRERFDDLPNLISYFNSLYSGQGCIINDDDLSLLKQYSWPGNIRELKNVIQSANILEKDIVLSLKEYVLKHLTNYKFKKPETNYVTLINNDSIIAAIDSCNGNISEAARQLGIARSTIYRRLKK